MMRGEFITLHSSRLDFRVDGGAGSIANRASVKYDDRNYFI